MKKAITIIVVIVIVFIIFLLLGPFYVVTEGEQAVVVIKNQTASSGV